MVTVPFKYNLVSKKSRFIGIIYWQVGGIVKETMVDRMKYSVTHKAGYNQFLLPYDAIVSTIVKFRSILFLLCTYGLNWSRVRLRNVSN